MDEPRVFTLEEAKRLVPRLNLLVGRQLVIAQEIARLVESLAPPDAPLARAIEASPQDDEGVRASRLRLLELLSRYRDGWASVSATGAVVKDTSLGLVDFCGEHEGRLVWLCWQLGETEISHFHELDEGFSARRPIDPRRPPRAPN